MDEWGSLKQTVTHLFDAVRYSQHAKELEEAAAKTEAELEAELNKLESKTEEMANLVSSFEEDPEAPMKELARQLAGFVAAAKKQAEDKLRRKGKEAAYEYRRASSSERDKATKSLEAYLADDPIPIIENTISVELADGGYSARSRYECEGGIKYEFGLAAQNSRLFHQEMTLSQLGYELKIPVRFSRALLSKSRVPGFERLDQYTLVDAEASAGRIRANFARQGNGAKVKIVTSGADNNGFVGIEYSDEAHAVNVMNDSALSVHLDLDAVRKAAAEVVGELNDLSRKKVALLKLSLDGEEPVGTIDCYPILQMVLEEMGPKYRSLVKRIAQEKSPKEGGNSLSLGFLRERLKVLGELAKPVSQTLGVQV